MAALVTLTRRADFLAAARARRRSSPGFSLQARRRGGDEPQAEVRIGYTCSKKVGNAVARNRAKRRLRAAARIALSIAGRPGWDYVLVGRPQETARREFALMTADLRAMVEALHTERRG